LTARIKGSVAKHESEQLTRRVKAKMAERAEAGAPHGKVAYGWRREQVYDDTGRRLGSRDVIHPEQADVVRKAAASIAAGDSLRAVTAGLNVAGTLGANGKPWSTTTLRSVLLRCSNAGLRKHQGQIIGKGTWEPLLDRDTYDRVVAILSDPSRRTSPASSAIKYLLSGIARCGVCGGPMRVLVVDDEVEMAALLARGLAVEGYEVDVAADGIEAMTLAGEQKYDLAVLDVSMPGMSGFELCRRLRDQVRGIGILLLTARDAVDDRVRGLDAGADDYLTKPFAFAELAARLRALRRREAVPTSSIEFGGLSIDLESQRISSGEHETRLSRTEFDLLRLLASRPDEVVPRPEILDTVWGSAAYIDQNIVDQYVSYLRKKLDSIDAGVRIVTARGVGFRLTAGPA